MHVGVLGPLVVEVGNGVVGVPGRRQRDLLAVLLLRRRTAVSPEALLDAVWRNESGLTVSVVHTAVARLRRLCGVGLIERRDAGYALARSIVTDADAFTEHVRSARRARRREDLAAAAVQYRAALADWRGPTPLADVSAHLVEADRARLTEVRVAVREELAELLLAHPEVGDAGEAGALAAAVMHDDPLRERAHELAMLAAYRDGRQASALAIYRELSRTLRDELGIEPGPSITRLHTLMLRQDPTLSRRHTSESRPARRQPRLPPAPLTTLVGRDATLADLIASIDGGRRLITLVGPGGVGKTRLLLEIGAHYRNRRPIEYGWLGAVTAADSAELAETIAMSLGLEVARTGAVRSLVAALAVDAWLVLVDEAEGVADALAPLATKVLQGNPAVQMVVTSRRPLDIAGELVVPVDPLEVRPANGADPREAAAVQLFLQRLADRAVAVDDSDETTTTLVDVVTRVDGLPLAVELVAGQASGRSLGELLRMVRAPLDIPAGLSRSARQRSMRATFATSLDRLDPLQRSVFRRLGVFAGSFDRQAARAVLTLDGDDGAVHTDDTVGPDRPDRADGAAIESAIAALTRDALVQVDRRTPGGLSFRLLTVVRGLAVEAVPPEELHQLRARHRAWFADRWRRDRGNNGLFDDVRDHHEDYLQALSSALAESDGDAIVELALTLSEYWLLSGARLAATKWLAAALCSPALSARGRARLQVRRATMLQVHDAAVVLADTTAAIEVLDPATDAGSVVQAHAVRAIERWLAGSTPEALADVDIGVHVAERCDQRWLAPALSAQALLHAVGGDHSVALAAAHRARTLLPDVPSAARRLTTTMDLSLALVNLGRFRDALAVLDDATEDLPHVLGGDVVAPVRFSINRGWAALGAGDPSGARSAFLSSLRRVGPVHADRECTEVLLGMGCVLAAERDPAAAELLDGARELMRRLAVPMSEEWRSAVERARRSAAANATADASIDADPAAITDASDAELIRAMSRVIDRVLQGGRRAVDAGGRPGVPGSQRPLG
jgi:DNA-binding SARP family transcriptional activator/tetratricopeptide (TPR) repeat protein